MGAKISYVVQDKEKVLLSRANEDDARLDKFLSYIANDIKENPSHIHTLDATLVTRAKQLVSGVEVDLEAPLPDEK